MTTSYDSFPITANYEEDALLEYCKQVTWENSIVSDFKRCNSSWPQVTLFNNLVPNIYQVAPNSIRTTYFSTLQKYGDFVKYFKAFAPGRRQPTSEMMDNDDDFHESKKYATWGYELIFGHQYLDDERYKEGILPPILPTGPMDYLLVIYPPFLAAAFELESHYLREGSGAGNKKKNNMKSSMAATSTTTPSVEKHNGTLSQSDDFHRHVQVKKK